MKELKWKIGFEVELLAPKGKSREDLAQSLASEHGGHSRRCFYLQSEPSAVPGIPIFENLVLGFDVFDSQNRFVAKCVDDLTIRRDLDRTAPSKAGWYRILSDDARLLQLIMAQCDPGADKDRVLDPVANLFGTQSVIEDETVRVADRAQSPIALAAPLPGERERPCEIITPPIEGGHFSRLQRLLDTATRLNFTVPHEAAVHIHFDASALCDTGVFCRLVDVTYKYRRELRQAVQTNTNCVRLGETTKGLYRLTRKQAFQTLEWPDACNRLKELNLTKYCDFNIRNFVYGLTEKATFEVRILPGTMSAQKIIANTSLFEAILNWCVNETGQSAPKTFANFSKLLGL